MTCPSRPEFLLTSPARAGCAHVVAFRSPVVARRPNLEEPNNAATLHSLRETSRLRSRKSMGRQQQYGGRHGKPTCAPLCRGGDTIADRAWVKLVPSA